MKAAKQSSLITRHIRRSTALGMTAIAFSMLSACGGASNPIGNSPTISNPTETSGKALSYAYFQKCINPIFLALLQTQIGNTTSTNTCAGSGCHATNTGAGGALRLIPSAQALDLSDAANTPTVIRASDMYKNFYSAQGAVIIGSSAQSRLLNKPLVRGVLHGGGLIFLNEDDPNAKLIKYWISRPVPVGQDEFSTANYNMFTPADPKIGTCNTQ
jgi:hypothetical protein